MTKRENGFVRRSLAVLATAGSVLLFAGSASAANFELLQAPQQDVRAGNLLVATEKLGDPAFAQSVILIVNRDDEGTVGLMINRRTNVPLSKIFPKRKRAGSDPVYVGGPVELTLVQALLRSPSQASKAARVLPEVYNTADKDAIEKGIDSRAGPSAFRIYLGYAGWAPAQLEREISLGAWSVMDGNAALVFDAHPDSLWSRLNARSHMRIVSILPPARAEIAALR